MKLLSAVVAAALTAGVSMTAVAAPTVPAGYVAYKCDNGKKLNVLYQFDRKGKAIGADVNAAGRQMRLNYDKRHSDSTGTTFRNKRGYMMSGGFIDKNTHTTSDIVGVTDARNRFIVKNCQTVNIDR